jgi:hypothetical protein
MVNFADRSDGGCVAGRRGGGSGKCVASYRCPRRTSARRRSGCHAGGAAARRDFVGFHSACARHIQQELAQYLGVSAPTVIAYGPKGLHQRGALREAVTRVLAAPRNSPRDEQLSVARFLADEAQQRREAFVPPPPRAWQTARRLAAIAAAVVGVALVAWLQPCVLKPEPPQRPPGALAKAALSLEIRAEQLLGQPGATNTVGALAAESLARVPNVRADATLRKAMSLVACRDDLAGSLKEWSVPLPGPARLVAAKSRPFLLALIGTQLFDVDTDAGTARPLPPLLPAEAHLLDFAISDVDDSFATLSNEHDTAGADHYTEVADTVRMYEKNGDLKWLSDSLGQLTGLAFKNGRLQVATAPVGPDSGCAGAGSLGEHWCGTIVDAETKKIVARYRAHASTRQARFAGNASLLALPRSYWDLNRSAPVSAFESCQAEALAFSGDGKRVACASSDSGLIRVGSITAPTETLGQMTFSSGVSHLLLDSHGSTLVATHEDDSLTVWDTASQRPIARRHFRGVSDVVFGPGERLAIVSGPKGLNATIVRPDDLIARACAACNLRIDASTFERVAGPEAARTCAVRR